MWTDLRFFNRMLSICIKFATKTITSATVQVAVNQENLLNTYKSIYRYRLKKAMLNSSTPNNYLLPLEHQKYKRFLILVPCQ